MSFVRFVFYTLLLALIKVGDAAYAIHFKVKNAGFWVVSAGIFLAIKSFFSLQNFGTMEKRAATNTIRRLYRLVTLLLSYCVHGLWKFMLAILSLFMEILIFLKSIILFPMRLFPKAKEKKTTKKVQLSKKDSTPTQYQNPKGQWKLKLKYALVGCIVALIFFFIPATFAIFVSDLPKLSNLSISKIPKTTKILDRNGSFLFEIYANQNRTIVPLSQIPSQLKQATIAIEDKDFYKHSGFDIRGIARAIYVDVQNKQLQGGSTITQQLIKSALLTPEPTISRKVRELVLAFWAENQYTKDQILELYFNYVPYGGTAWGIESASQIYFGKDVSALSLSESAFLAGLPQAPSQYSPFIGDGNRGKNRQKDVLNAMVSEGYITREQATEAYEQKLVFKSPQVSLQAPHFVMYVKDLLIKKYGLYDVERGGLTVTTSLDMNTQKMAEGVVADQVIKDSYLGIGNGAALVTNPKNGDIMAMVGSVDYFDNEKDGNVNLTTARRQPGSTIKMVTYALALSRGYTEASIIEDTPLTIKNTGSGDYTPVNYDGRFHGRVPLRIAFSNSYNIPAVKIAQRFGVEEIVAFGKEMGITSWGAPSNYGVSITLGAAETSMLDLATVYGTVANSGKRVDLDPILKIVDADGRIIQQKEDTGVQVLDPGISFIISDILADNRSRSLAFGSNSPLVIPNKRVSVKTGTTDNKRDNWTIGYTQDLVVAAWVGNNDNTPLSPALSSGITGAAPIWNRIMTNLVQNRDTTAIIPENIIAKQCFGFTAYFVIGSEGQGCRNVVTPTKKP